MAETILTSEQRKVLEFFAQEKHIASLFYLSGGTALAEFYLRHRYSDDLDFFTNEKEFPQIHVEAFAAFIKQKLPAVSMQYRRLYDRRIFFFATNGGELKIEFSSYPFMQLEPPQEHKGVFIDSLNDITANKVMALLDRVEPKDFVDLYFLMEEKQTSIDELISLVRQKFGITLDPITLGSEFAKVTTLTVLPRMIKALTLEQLRRFFSDRARELGSRIFSD